MRRRRKQNSFMQSFLILCMSIALVLQILVALHHHATDAVATAHDSHQEELAMTPIRQRALSGESLSHHQQQPRNVLEQIQDRLHCSGQECIDEIARLQSVARGAIAALTHRTTGKETEPHGSLTVDHSRESMSALSTRSVRSSNRKACVCAIVKNEERYIDEWVDYNLGIGFDKIYLFDSSDDFTLHDWSHNRQEDKRIQVIHHPGEAQQFRAYRLCVKHHARKEGMHYVAFFDADEFLQLKQHETVSEFLDQYLASGQLSINRYTFGTSNRTEYEPIPVTQRFLYREKQVDQHVKSIAVLDDMKRGLMMKTPHYVWTRNETRQTDTRGHILNGALNPGGPVDIAVFHHYQYKSVAEFREKGCVRGRADVAKKDQCDLVPLVGEVYDDTAWVAMQKYVPR